jgi:hypothetical protein
MVWPNDDTTKECNEIVLLKQQLLDGCFFTFTSERVIGPGGAKRLQRFAISDQERDGRIVQSSDHQKKRDVKRFLRS